MSMPQFPKLDMTLDQSLNSILASIAMEEAALSHILNAEGEKIQYALASCADLDQVMKINRSVTDLVESILDLQIVLKSKMRLALNHLPKSEGYTKKCNCKYCC